MKSSIKILESVLNYAGIENKRGKWGILADEIGYKLDSLYAFTKKGVRNNLSADLIACILNKYPQISKTYLETGTGDMLKLDSGISNYGHSDRANEVASAYEQMSNEDKEIFYSLAVKFRKNREAKLKAFDEAFE